MTLSSLIIQGLEPVYSVCFELVFTLCWIELVIVDMPFLFRGLSMLQASASVNVSFRDRNNDLPHEIYDTSMILLLKILKTNDV